MKRHYQYSILLIALAVSHFVWAEGTNEKFPVDTCIGNICLEKKNFTYQSTKKLFGVGSVATVGRDEIDKRKLCYFDAQQQMWVLLEFDTHSNYRQVALETIFVSTEQVCAVKTSPSLTLHEFKTNGGIRVGMDEAVLIKLKGQPARIDDSVEREKNARFSFRDTLRAPRFGEKVFVYVNSDRVQFNFFYINDGKVKSILVSDSE